MTVSNEQIQATLNAHENRFVVNEAAIAHHDATFADIRRNLDHASQILDRVAARQEEARQEAQQRQEEARQEAQRRQEEARQEAQQRQEEAQRRQEETQRQLDLLVANDARLQAKMESNQEYIAILAASITELRNTVADIVRSQGGTPSS
jgi:vacuolar-type H+-ATPase subunit E/Vma4